MRWADLTMKLKMAREGLDLSTRDVAASLHVSNSTITRWENGERQPSYEDLERWGAAVGVRVDLCVEDAGSPLALHDYTSEQHALMTTARRVLHLVDERTARWMTAALASLRGE